MASEIKQEIEKISGIFTGLESWKDILEKAGASETYNKVCNISNLVPPKQDIFNAFRYFDPKDLKVILLGQDPYYNGDACGLAFATNNGNCPKSLTNIYNNLIKNELCSKNVKRNGNLKCWAAQGVLLLNTALTTIEGKAKEHTAIWDGFTRNLMKQLNDFKQNLFIMLWGGDAKSYAKYFDDKRHIILKWSHPSPMADKNLPEHLKFKNCDHFKLIKNIKWNPEQKIMVWTDGACSGNGKETAIASFACMLIGGYLERTAISGKVKPEKYFLSNDSIISDSKMTEVPTNNRGELLGIIYALFAIEKSCISGEIEIFCDSQYCINTVEEYYPNRLKKGTEGELANLDLLKICGQLLGKIRSNSEVKFTHVNSHQSIPENSDDRTKCIYGGNDVVDKLAVSAKELNHFNVVVETGLPILLKKIFNS